MNKDKYYQEFIDIKKKDDNFFMLKIKNYKEYIEDYLKNKQEFVYQFFDHIQSILGHTVYILKFLEKNYYSFYSDYILDEGYNLSLFEDKLQEFNNLKKLILDNRTANFKIEDIKTSQYYDIFFNINKITHTFKIIEEAIYESDFSDSTKEIDELLDDILNNQLDALELINYIVEIEEFIKEKQEIKTDFSDLLFANQAASKIQNTIRKRLSTREDAARKIQTSYKTRLSILTNNLPLGELLCKPPNIGIFTEELKRLTNNTNIISNLKLFYCKMGSKNLSLIKEINNSIFLNTSFKSTNLENIKFNNVTFYSGVKYKMMLEKKKLNIKNVYSGPVNNRESTIIFDEAKFKNNEFNNCKFLGNFIDKAKINNLKFKKCIFELSKEIEFSNFKKNNVKDTNGIQHTFILHEYDNNNHKVIEKTEKLLCSMLFDDCTFKNTTISFLIENSIDEIPLHFKNTVFNNIVFYGSINKILFDNCIFDNCKFENNKCLNVTFNGCEFNECNFNSVNFSSNKSNKNLTYITNSKIANCQFIGCLLNNYISNYFYNINDFIFDNTSIVNTIIAYCNLVMFKFNIKPDHSKKMIMKNNRFVCNDLFGTNFSYCDLEGSSFAATVNCGEKINWFGNVFIKLPKLSDTKQNKIFELSKNMSISDDKKLLLLNNNPIKDSEDHVFKKIIQYFSLGEHTSVMFENQVANKGPMLYITQEQYADILSIDVKDLLFTWDVNIQDAKNKFKSYHDYYNVLLKCNHFYLWLVPPTNFHNANIKTCNFQQLEGFTGFDFAEVSQIKDGDRMRPDLNATNFTGCIMNYANFQYANIIGTIFQASNITRANFKNTKFNDNTDFENANFEEAINTDHINIGNLRQGANETHARSQVIVDNYQKLYEFFSDSKNYSVKTDAIIISVDYNTIIPILINNINNNINLDNKEKHVIKLYFTSYIPFSISEYLNLNISNQKDKKLHDKIKENFKICVDDTFIDLLIKKYTNSVDGKTIGWSWLEITYASIKFLLKQTETYIYTFIQYYFNEVFNAHGEGSKSCPKGMIERLITIHSQVAEFYNATFMDVDPNNSKLINQLSKYDSEREDDPSFKGDSFINEDYIKNYDSEKFKFNKLINLTKPNSNLPEKDEEDLGFTIDYSLSPANREEADKILKMLCKSDEKIGESVDTLNKLCMQYAKALVYVILSNHKYKDEPILLRKLHPDLKGNPRFNKILFELKNYILKNEIPAFRESVIYLYGTEESDIKSEDIIDYLTGGASKSKSNKKRKTQTIKKSRLSNKNKTSSRSKNKLFIEDNKTIISENKIGDFIKIREKDIVKKYLQLSYKDLQQKLETKIMTINNNIDKTNLKKLDNSLEVKTISLKDNLMFNYIKVPKLQTSILYKGCSYGQPFLNHNNIPKGLLYL